VQGWGIEGESWNFMEALGRLGGETWFALGDRDLATHVVRTQRLREGASLSRVTHELSHRLGIAHRVVPMSDDAVATLVETSEGTLNFQDYFVRHRCTPRVTGFRFLAAQESSIQPDLHAALGSPSLQAVIVCPSNPFVSIGPILAVPGLRQMLERSGVPVVAVSPLIGGRAVKGPLAKMMMELGVPITNEALAEHYRGIVTAWVIDQVDDSRSDSLRKKGFQCRSMSTLMKDDNDRVELAQRLLRYCNDLGA
jgi:LPPG:FO 2-phospho-L-lactate transferase